jgi:CubicO group peptidase (beta-lactamase class C family)
VVPIESPPALCPLLINVQSPWMKPFGSISVEDGAADMKDEIVMWVALCTKLMTTVAANALCGEGALKVEEDTSRLLPELISPDILVGFDDNTGAPLWQKASTPIPLRQLLTHSSGMGYDTFNL